MTTDMRSEGDEMNADIWDATGKQALDAEGREAFTTDKTSDLFWRVEEFDIGLRAEPLENARDAHLAQAENVLHHWIEMIRSEQRKRLHHPSGRWGK